MNLSPTITLTILLLCSGALWLLLYRLKRHKQKILRLNNEIWSIGIYEGPNPFTLAPAPGIKNPILTAGDVTDVQARFVADPFMIEHKGNFHLFFEVLNSKRERGEIAHAQSKDLKQWQYTGVVLRERHHLSYPCIFKHEGSIYMIPEYLKSKEIRLYQATAFPNKWRHVSTLLKGKNRYAPLSDPSIIHHEGRWYLLINARKLNSLYLFSADTLTGEWREHPQSPVIVNSIHYSRPGGGIVKHNGELYRFSQDGYPHYGSKVWAFRITELSPERYKEELVPGCAVVQAGDEGWNNAGMHTVDAHQREDGRWIAIVDGLEHKTRSTGREL